MSLYYSQLWRKLTTDVFVLFTTEDPSKKLIKRFLCTPEIRNLLAISDGSMFTIVTLSRIIAWNVGLLTVSCSSLFSYKISDITQNIWKSHTFDPGKTKDTIIRTFSFSRGAVRSTASSYAAMLVVAGSRPVLVIAWEWHIGLALLCGCSGALEYPTTNSCWPINKSLSLSLLNLQVWIGQHPKILNVALTCSSKV